MNPIFGGLQPIVGGGIGGGMGNIPMTNGVPTANLIALLHLQQQQGLQTIQQQVYPGQMPGVMPGLATMPPPELGALMMSGFTPKPEEAPCVVYVGNLISGITSDQLNKFFGSVFSPAACMQPTLLMSMRPDSHACSAICRDLLTVWLTSWQGVVWQRGARACGERAGSDTVPQTGQLWPDVCLRTV